MPRYLFLFLLLVAGCARAPQPQRDSSTPVVKATVPTTPRGAQSAAIRSLPRDDLGREIKLANVPQRIVTIGPGATETVFALGAGRRLVGRDSASDYPAAALKVPVAGDFNGPALEAVIAARPDLVIVQGETYGRTRIEDWQRKIGAPVASLAATTVEGVAQDMEKIGAWLGVRDRARQLARTLAFSPHNVGRGKLSVFFEVGRSPLFTAGRGTLIDNIISTAGLSNIARSVNGYKQYNTEALLSRPPSIYVVTQAGSTPPPRGAALRKLRNEMKQKLLRVPGLSGLRCVQQATIVIVPGDWVLRPGPRLRLGLQEMNRQAYEMIET
jgi:iron complex transport system substrate-binding protein